MISPGLPATWGGGDAGTHETPQAAVPPTRRLTGSCGERRGFTCQSHTSRRNPPAAAVGPGCTRELRTGEPKKRVSAQTSTEQAGERGGPFTVQEPGGGQMWGAAENSGPACDLGPPQRSWEFPQLASRLWATTQRPSVCPRARESRRHGRPGKGFGVKAGSGNEDRDVEMLLGEEREQRFERCGGCRASSDVNLLLENYT